MEKISKDLETVRSDIGRMRNWLIVVSVAVAAPLIWKVGLRVCDCCSSSIKNFLSVSGPIEFDLDEL